MARRPLRRPHDRAAGERHDQLGVAQAVGLLRTRRRLPAPRRPRCGARAAPRSPFARRARRGGRARGARRPRARPRGRARSRRSRSRRPRRAASRPKARRAARRRSARASHRRRLRRAARHADFHRGAQVEQLAVGVQRAGSQDAVGDREVHLALVAVQRLEALQVAFLAEGVHAERERERRGAGRAGGPCRTRAWRPPANVTQTEEHAELTVAATDRRFGERLVRRDTDDAFLARDFTFEAGQRIRARATPSLCARPLNSSKTAARFLEQGRSFSHVPGANPRRTAQQTTS